MFLTTCARCPWRTINKHNGNCKQKHDGRGNATVRPTEDHPPRRSLVRGKSKFSMPLQLRDNQNNVIQRQQGPLAH